MNSRPCEHQPFVGKATGNAIPPGLVPWPVCRRFYRNCLFFWQKFTSPSKTFIPPPPSPHGPPLFPPNADVCFYKNYASMLRINDRSTSKYINTLLLLYVALPAFLRLFLLLALFALALFVSTTTTPRAVLGPSFGRCRRQARTSWWRLPTCPGLTWT